jgi:hypothetical protein
LSIYVNKWKLFFVGFGVTEIEKEKGLRSVQGVWNDRNGKGEGVSVNAGCLE